MNTTLNKIRSKSPCADGWAKLLKHLGKPQTDDEPLSLITILDSNGLDDALWCLQAVDGHDREIRLYAVWCARQVQHLMTDKRSLDAIDVAERFANGLATENELDIAWAAARAAARAAAGDAAWDAALAEFERNLIRERTHAGLAAARARGRKGGRKPSLSSQQVREIKALLRDPSIPVTAIAGRYGVSRTTIYKHAGANASVRNHKVRPPLRADRSNKNMTKVVVQATKEGAEFLQFI